MLTCPDKKVKAAYVHRHSADDCTFDELPDDFALLLQRDERHRQ